MILPFEPIHDDAIIAAAAGLTMLQTADIDLAVGAMDYIARAEVPGVVVNCGVYKGGYSLACALAMERAGIWRGLWLYDTYSGMTPPDDGIDEAHPRDHVGTLAASLDDVRRVLGDKQARYIVGDVKRTLPAIVPGAISFLHLDVDWYDNTRACLEYLYPLLSPGGVLVVDDYFYWPGCRKACDEYLGRREWFRVCTSGTITA